MPLSRLSENPRIVGIKAVKRGILKGVVQEVFIARDAEPQLVQEVRALAKERLLPVDVTSTMQEIGRACAIERRAAVAAVVARQSVNL